MLLAARPPSSLARVTTRYTLARSHPRDGLPAARRHAVVTIVAGRHGHLRGGTKDARPAVRLPLGDDDHDGERSTIAMSSEYTSARV